MGAFAVSCGFGCEEVCAKLRSENDDYKGIMMEAVADRLAEAFAELLHVKMRTELWGNFNRNFNHNPHPYSKPSPNSYPSPNPYPNPNPNPNQATRPTRSSRVRTYSRPSTSASGRRPVITLASSPNPSPYRLAP